MWNGMSAQYNDIDFPRFRINHELAVRQEVKRTLNNMFEPFHFGNVDIPRLPRDNLIKPLERNLQQQSIRSFSPPRTARWSADLSEDEFNIGPITKFQQRKKERKCNNDDNLSRPFKASKTTVRQPKTSSTVQIERCLRFADWMEDLTPFIKVYEKARKYYADPSKDWFIGNSKKSYTYLLLDPRVTKNLPARRLKTQSQWTTFIKSIFYVGKGKSERSYKHLTEALPLWDKRKWSDDKKLQTILDIWEDGMGVICLQVFHNLIPAEAFTYEAAMIDALGLENLTNLVSGSYKGVLESWTEKEQRMLGVYLLHKAMKNYLNEGERQLHPDDIE